MKRVTNKKNLLILLVFAFTPTVFAETTLAPVEAKEEPVIVARRLASKKSVKTRSKSRSKSKQKSKAKPKQPSKPNAKTLYNDVAVHAKPNSSSKTLITLDEGVDVRVSKKMKDNFIYVRVIKNGQKVIGWVHRENLLISPKILQVILNNNKAAATKTSPEDDFNDPELKKPEEREKATEKHLEKTLILPQKLNFVTWKFMLDQGLYSASAAGVNSEVTSSTVALALNFLVGISENTNFTFEIPYQIKGSTKSSSTAQTASTKSKGFKDFTIGFKNRLLSQKNSFDLVVEALWKSGFMSSSIATPSSTGGAGTGSHDFIVSLTLGKNYQSWGPHLKIEGTKIGSSKRHAADDSYSQSYTSTNEFKVEFGFELPQLKPLIILDPYLSYAVRGKRSVKTIQTVETDTEIDSQKIISGGMNLYLYKTGKTFVFKYNYKKIADHNSTGSKVTDLNQHSFSAGIRF